MTSYSIGVLSDTHCPGSGGSLPFEQIRQHFQKVDHILHAGDIVSEEVLTLLGAIAAVDAVAGNMDPYEVAGRLPEKSLLHLGGAKIGLVHGALALPPEDMLRYYFRDEKPDVLIFGHTHRPFNEHINGILFFNPGSPVKPRSGPPTIGIIRLTGGTAEGSIIPLHL